ncbi:MAG: hypothetical protein L6Q54_00085 [Leptospiraceae bacterium]|nr:hypothetical protein [Leptospiraceae bacterium]MCK6379636.1 hypothetical protein [Leptospiraceae bacterium]NUM43037.1 hypothetical protein [Leptospiraceae bacterium]
MKTILLTLLIGLPFYYCGEVDKSYNKDEKREALFCFTLHPNSAIPQSLKDITFTSCMIWVKNKHQKRVKSDGGINCWDCHKSLKL